MSISNRLLIALEFRDSLMLLILLNKCRLLFIYAFWVICCEFVSERGCILYLKLSKLISNSEETFCLPLFLFVFFLSWLPEVQTALKVNKTPLVSHWEHISGEKQREPWVVRGSVVCLFVCLVAYSTLWEVFTHVTLLSLLPGLLFWQHFSYNSYNTLISSFALSCFCRPFWHIRFSLRAFHLNKCVCN